MLLKFSQKQSLPTSNEVELQDAFRREVNSAMQEVLQEMEQESVKQWTNLRVTQSQRRALDEQ